MKKGIIIFIVILLLLIVSFFVPVKSEQEWINDDPISEVGHYETYNYNIYGIKLNKN